MDFILDNTETEAQYQALLKAIKLRKSGEVADSMNQQGANYKMNWGASLLDLRDLAKQYQRNHLLALKLWNKQWRETLILATMLDNPEEVSEEQMDFWTKSMENTEIAEQASANLWVHTKFAYVKALEWCRGKKHIVRFSGIHLMGRLAITDKKAIDEMFDAFFDELPVLAKDPKLYTPLYRASIALGTRSKLLNQQCRKLAEKLQISDMNSSVQLGQQLLEELSSDYVQDMLTAPGD